MARITAVYHNRTKPTLADGNLHQEGSLIGGISCSLAEKKRVAAYCRVSTLEEEQELSFENQRDYYKAMIESNPDYYLVEIYGDHGKSGLNVAGRPDFQRMIRDCRNGRIDHIYTKSVSRFARNASECLEYIRELQSFGVVVHFEKEAFTTADDNIEMILSFLAILAQEEANSISQSITWAHKNRNKVGDPIMAAVYGYTREKKVVKGIHHWNINEKEAIRVRMVYSLFLEGKGYTAIAEELSQYEKVHGKTRDRWTPSGVKHLLLSEKYVGDVLTGKTYVADYTKKIHKINKGEREQQYIRDHHPAIISREDKKRVEELVEARKRK